MKMENFNFINKLRCIKCNGHNLAIENNETELHCLNCNYKYRITNKVLEMLPEDPSSVETTSEWHSNSGSTFKYIQHYQKDAQTSNYFEKREGGTEHGERRVREYISSEISKKNGTVLDVGCGKAWVSEKFCKQGYEVISMDISLLNTTKALQLYPYSNHHAIVADAFSLPFREASFDYIIASEIIEHVYDPAAFIANLVKALNPGGKLIVTTPYKEKLQYSLCIHCNKPTPLHAHIHSFDENILKSLYSGNDIKLWKYFTFSNKVLSHLRTHIFLKFLPFSLWKTTDEIVNAVYNAPERIMVVWEKCF